MYRPHTRYDVERLEFKNEHKDYNLTVKFNSYKDSTIEVDIVDNNGIKLNTILINFNRKEFDVKIINIINRLLKNKIKSPYTNSYSNTIKTKVEKCILFAKKLAGTVTEDYNTHECQSLLYIKSSHVNV